MARARNIKPGFFDNEILGELPALTRLLFIGLWCLADREGRLQDRPKRIKKELLGYDDVTADDVDTMLQQLNDNGFIQRYEIAGEQYIQVTNFLKESTLQRAGECNTCTRWRGYGPRRCGGNPRKRAHGNSWKQPRPPDLSDRKRAGKHKNTRYAQYKHSASTRKA